MEGALQESDEEYWVEIHFLNDQNKFVKYTYV